MGLFLLSAAGISLTGVMLPGPMTAATIAKGYSDRHAGVRIAAGHAVIEVPLIAIMAAIYFGSGSLAGSPRVETIIYLAGGLVLIYLGSRMFRATGEATHAIGGDTQPHRTDQRRQHERRFMGPSALPGHQHQRQDQKYPGPGCIADCTDISHPNVSLSSRLEESSRLPVPPPLHARQTGRALTLSPIHTPDYSAAVKKNTTPLHGICS